MKRASYFLSLLLVVLGLLFLTATWYLSRYPSGTATVGGMMGQMMGNQYASGMATAMPYYVWVVLAALFVLVVGGVAGIGYYLAYPEIKTVAPPSEQHLIPQPASSARVDWSVLLKTSKPEERRVLEVIASHDGKYLQKFIVKEAGLSRLKTHRLISRFAERGIVTVSRSGNTNEVSLAAWLKPEPRADQHSQP